MQPDTRSIRVALNGIFKFNGKLDRVIFTFESEFQIGKLGYAFNSRAPHILWPAVAADCGRGEPSGGGRGAGDRGSLRLVAGRDGLV